MSPSPVRVLAPLVLLLAGLVGLAAPASASAVAPVAAGEVVFSGPASDGGYQAFAVGADGTGKRQLTWNLPGARKCDPVASPDGTELAYAANDGGMYVHELLSGAVHRIAPPLDPGVLKGGGRRPAWTADGQSVVFHFTTQAADAPEAQQVFDLWIVDRKVDGGWTPARRITQLPLGAAATQPRVSRDGWLSYSYSSAPGVTPDVYVARVVSGMPAATSTGPIGQRLLPGSGGRLTSWNSTGAQLAFVTACSNAVQVVDVSYDGTTWTARNQRSVAQSGGCGLSWSRTEATRLVYADSGRMYVKDVAAPKTKATVLGTGIHPSW